MIEITGYQAEQMALFFVNSGFVLIIAGWCGHFIYKGFKKK